MVADKTGALLSCAASLGAVLVGGPESLSAALRDYGLHLGMAFQLIDDLLGIWGVADRTGKPVRSDLASRKKSLPVVAAMTSGSDAGQRLSEIYGTDGELGDELLAAAAQAVDDAGGRAWATAEAHRETVAAHAIIARLDVPQDVRADLEALTTCSSGGIGDRSRTVVRSPSDDRWATLADQPRPRHRIHERRPRRRRSVRCARRNGPGHRRADRRTRPARAPVAGAGRVVADVLGAGPARDRYRPPDAVGSERSSAWRSWTRYARSGPSGHS